jgi:hypothetical protein
MAGLVSRLVALHTPLIYVAFSRVAAKYFEGNIGLED